MKTLTILGSTGSIGVSTLDVVARNPDRFRVAALSANSGDERMAEQCIAWQPRHAVMADAAAAERLRGRLAGRCDTEVLAGAEGLARIASLPEVDQVMAAIVGAAGLLPTLAAARAGKRVLLANKEALVMSGALFMEAVRAGGAELMPIDSEHNAIFQCMPGDLDQRADQGFGRGGVRRILLTGSGGPFRTRDVATLDEVTPEEAVAHPNWVMGRKISVDSATMMNKGLELIEACWLFDARPDDIEVVLHPQSVIHSMVQYVDGSVIAQLGNPDMRTPIAHAMAWPERVDAGVADLDMMAVARLDFGAPDLARFPCLRLAGEAARAGGGASAVLNAANEVAVEAFLADRIRFTDIARVVETTLAEVTVHEPADLDGVLAIDEGARVHAADDVARRTRAAA